MDSASHPPASSSPHYSHVSAVSSPDAIHTSVAAITPAQSPTSLAAFPATPAQNGMMTSQPYGSYQMYAGRPIPASSFAPYMPLYAPTTVGYTPGVMSAAHLQPLPNSQVDGSAKDVTPGGSRDFSQSPYASTDSHGQDPDSSGARRQRWMDTAPYWKPTTQSGNIYSMDRTKSYTIRLNPRIERGFFIADNDWTCYRRNYFQVSISFSVTDQLGQRVEMPCLLMVDNHLHSVTAFFVGVSARTSNGQREVELVQHTAKRDKGPQMLPEPKICQPQDNLNGRPPIDSFHSVTYERLQFKAATANNGKRRAAQQYHVLVADLYAELADKSRYRIASTESAPLVVRGRAPGHYALMHNKTGAGGHAGRSTPSVDGLSDEAVVSEADRTQAYMSQAGPSNDGMAMRPSAVLPPPSALAGYPQPQSLYQYPSGGDMQYYQHYPYPQPPQRPQPGQPQDPSRGKQSPPSYHPQTYSPVPTPDSTVHYAPYVHPQVTAGSPYASVYGYPAPGHPGSFAHPAAYMHPVVSRIPTSVSASPNPSTTLSPEASSIPATTHPRPVPSPPREDGNGDLSSNGHGADGVDVAAEGGEPDANLGGN